MKNNILNFINKLEGFKTAIKNLHWSSSNMSEHKLFDDIASSVSDIQDEISETEQGMHGQIKKNELKPTSYEIKSSKEFLSDLLNSTNEFYKTLNGDDYIGMRSSVENFLGEINKFQYLLKLCLKEDFKQKIKNKINEAFKSPKLDKLNREHGGMDWGKYNASELSDDEIGDTFDRYSRGFNSNHDITFKDGSGVHVHPNQRNRNINNGFGMTPDKEGYERHKQLTQRMFGGNRDYKDEYHSENPHYNRIKYGFNRLNDNGKHELHPSWRENFKPGERDSEGRYMRMDGNGDGPGTWGGEEDYGSDMQVRKNGIDHAKDWYKMHNMDRDSKRNYLKSKYANIHPSLMRDETKMENRETFLNNVVNENIKKYINEEVDDWYVVWDSLKEELGAERIVQFLEEYLHYDEIEKLCKALQKYT